MKKPAKPCLSQQKFLKCGSTLLICTSNLLGVPALAQDVTLSAQTPFVDATEAYEQSHWTEAFLGFSRLAEKGDSEAARIAFQMFKYGTVLYKTEFPITGSQYARWRTAAKTDLGSK